MSCVICTGALTEEPDDLLGSSVFSGLGGPSDSKKRRSSATSGGGGGDDGPSTSKGFGRGWGGSEEETGISSTSCGHIYHRACIVRWLKGNTKKCPLCQEKITKKGLKTVYLTGDGLERSERKLKAEVEEKNKQLVESKRGQREMSQRIDELFDENEEMKKKNGGLEEKIRMLEEMWRKSKNKELGKRGGLVEESEEMKREMDFEKMKRETAEKMRGLEAKIREFEVKNRDLKEKNWDLDLKVRAFEKKKEEEEEWRKFWDEKRQLDECRREEKEKREAERKRELEEKNQLLIGELNVAKLKQVEAELKYLKMRGKVDEMTKMSGALNAELQLLGREMDGGDD